MSKTELLVFLPHIIITISFFVVTQTKLLEIIPDSSYLTATLLTNSIDSLFQIHPESDHFSPTPSWSKVHYFLLRLLQTFPNYLSVSTFFSPQSILSTLTERSCKWDDVIPLLKLSDSFHFIRAKADTLQWPVGCCYLSFLHLSGFIYHLPFTHSARDMVASLFFLKHTRA